MNGLTYKRERLTDLGRLRKWIYDCQQRGGIVTDFWKVIYTLLCLKWITNKDILSSTWNSAQCYMPDWMGTEFGWVPLLFTWNYHNTVNWLCAVLSLVSHVWLFVTPCTIAYHASLSVEFLQARILKWVAMPSSRGSSQPSSPTLEVDSLPSEPPGKPKNAGVGSLSLLQDIFPSQELNQDLLHCRWIHYQRKLNWPYPNTK